MSRFFFRYAIRFSALAMVLTMVPHQAVAIPFAAESTTRQSIAITGDGAQQLTRPSSSLRFSRTDRGLYLVFASQDESPDNADLCEGAPDCSNDLCTTDNKSHIFWVDTASTRNDSVPDRPAVCVSVRGSGTEITSDASNPMIGGSDDDTGRYVAFVGEDDVLTAGAVGSQILIHDRKWEETWLSQSQNCLAENGPPDGPSSLHMLTDNGKDLLFTSTAANIWDNLEPKCGGDATNAQLYTRDGGTCKDPGKGECKTDIAYDDYEYHAGANTVDFLNGASFSAHMNQDKSVKVFHTASTVPVSYLPDTRGHLDVFSHINNRFFLISQAAVTNIDESTNKITVVNSGGPANGDSKNPKVSADGNLIVFESAATDLVLIETGSGVYAYKATNDKSQIYLYDRRTRQISMMSVIPPTTPGMTFAERAAGNGDSTRPFISRDGRYIVFESTATNLVAGITTTSYRNIFALDRNRGEVYLVTPGVNPNYPAEDTRTTQGLNANATITDVSAAGLTVAYETGASNAINGSVDPSGNDDNGVMDVFMAFNSCPEDSDGDETPDCLDDCPNDSNKHEEGQCGCGNPDTDTDNDGTADCNDECPNSAIKQAPGSCGCDVLDTDSDGDGAPDCVDGCPSNPSKTTAGICGCGLADDDANGNGNADCIDPAAGDVPNAPIVKVVRRRTDNSTRVRIAAASQYPGASVQYEFTVSKVGRATVSRSRSKRAIRVRALKTIKSSRPIVVVKKLAKGRYSANYKVIAGTTETQASTATGFRVR